MTSHLDLFNKQHANKKKQDVTCLRCKARKYCSNLLFTIDLYDFEPTSLHMLSGDAANTIILAPIFRLHANHYTTDAVNRRIRRFVYL
jgi:hypothetical protein